MIVGTRDAALRPEVIRAVGAVVGADRTTLTVFVPSALAARTLANLEHDGALAVTFSEIMTHRTLQVKGRLRELRRARRAERALQERWLAAFAEQLHATGFSRRIARRLRIWPSVALELAVEELFVQTPGPKAGSRIEAAR